MASGVPCRTRETGAFLLEAGQTRKRRSRLTRAGTVQGEPMSQLVIRGVVLLEGEALPVAGVSVVATMDGEAAAAALDARAPGGLRLGEAVTAADGSFSIQTDPDDAQISRWACVLRSCSDFTFRLICMDRDDAVLHETGPFPYSDDLSIGIVLREPGFEPSRGDWQELASRLMGSQTVRLGAIAKELATLAPNGVFGDWTGARRLGFLGRLEQALLDPDGAFAQAGVRVRFARLAGEAELESLREELRRLDRPDLVATLDETAARARKLGGFAEIEPYVNPDAIGAGDVIGGVNDFLEPDFPTDIFPWLKSPLVGYRDYLRDRWSDHERFEPVLGGPDAEVASRSTMLARLNGRFHQDFATKDTTDQPANQVLVGILLTALQAAPGTGYGFGLLPAAIEPQGERTHREYLDYLIGLSGIALEELEKRYRLNLRRSDLEVSSLVQQNIDTLQRFFTDSYQSIEDPFPVTPDRKPGTPELLIPKFPLEGAGPFFLEYEEWLAREEPFYPENHFDPRATYQWAIWERLQKTRDILFAKSMPLGTFIETAKHGGKFDPNSGGYNHLEAKWQWVRNHVELWELIVAANNDMKSLNYVGAEEKYKLALFWTSKLRDFTSNALAWWQYDPAAFAKEQKNADVSTIDKLAEYERRYHRNFGQHYDSSAGTVVSDLLPGDTEISEHWWGKDEAPFFWHGNKREIRYLLDYLLFRYLPACLSDVALALGKHADAVRHLVGREDLYAQTYRWFAGPAGFNIFAAKQAAGGPLQIVKFKHYTDGPLAYASSSDRTQYPPPNPPTSVPTNRAELGYFKLKLGNAALEWADVLYRSAEPDSIMRARELYKAVIFLHDEDPEITPSWARRGTLILPPFPWMKSKGNPAIVSQVARARLGFLQINAGLNFYGVSASYVPPVRYRVLKEAAERFAAGARGAQSDFLSYMQQLDQLTVSEMTARTMVAKAGAAMSIAQEQQKIAEFHVGEVQKQVDAINAQIAAKKAEIAQKDSFFEQLKDFAGGMKDSVGKLGEMAFAGEAEAGAASAQQLSTGDILKLGFKVGTASNVLGGATSALGGAAGVAGPFGAFLYAGVTSMSSLADAYAKRAGELAHLQNVALPAAKALVELKKRDVTIAQLSQTIAKADWQLGKDLLSVYAQRFLNRAFLVTMSEFSNRLMRRYLDLAGKTAWLAERALAFEQDRELGIIAFDYFPRNLRGVSGADLLQLHLAELEAARIQGLTQTIPVKQTISLARDFPIQFGQLKRTGSCRFATSEQPLRLAYPGVYGYRIRNVTIAANYAAPIQPHRGLFSNQGISVVTRDKPGSAHNLVRYPDALPLSEFRMREDMWVFDLPDETLLPFEGSGIETVWELMVSKAGNANSLEPMTDFLITFDMRASYSALLAQQHLATPPATANRSLLASGKALNPGALPKFRDDGGKVTLAFDLAKLARNANEAQRKTLNFVLVAVGASDAAFTATFSSATPVNSKSITFEKGVALSNAGVLADGNGGVALPLNSFVGLDVDQVFKLVIDADANPGSDLSNLQEVLLLVEYEATF
jgi:hypothetical protein